MTAKASRHSPDRPTSPAHLFQSTQIYEGTNQIQRVVMAKKLLG